MTRRLAPYLVLYFLAAAMPSAPVFQRYLGVGGAVAYIVAIAVIVALLPRILPTLLHRVSTRAAIALGVVALLAIIALFTLAYPRLNTHEANKGSDRDDALNVGVEEMLHGRYPYDARTYLGAPISPGPGALVQSIPFWLLGNAAYQNFFWLPVFIFVASKLLRDVTSVIVISLLTIALCPALVGLEVMVGGDFVANSLYVLSASILVMLATKRRMIALITAAALLGLLLSSRAVYGFIVPLVLVYVWREATFKRATGVAGALLAALLAISLPFYLHAPRQFGPLAAQNKFEELHAFPHFGAIAVASTALLSIALSLWLLQTKDAITAKVMASCAIVLIYPALLGLVVECVAKRELTFAFAGWASCGTFFAAVALAATSAHQATASARCAADRPDCS